MSSTDSLRTSARASPPPALALVVHRAQSLLAERRRGADALAMLVELDAVLTGSVVRVVRCPLYMLSGTPPGLSASVEMIGRTAFERLLRSLPLVEDEPPSELERACRQWIHA